MQVDDILKDISRWREKNKVSVFVGAGVSRLSGYPSWAGLVRSMSDEIGYTQPDQDVNFTSEEFLKIPQMYHIQFQEEKYREKVMEGFSGVFNTNDIHDLIFALHPNHILTTNYDDLLEREAVKVGRNFSVINSDSAVSSTPSSSYIIKVHGDFLSDFVLKEQDYLDYEENYMLIDKLVKTVFATNLVIFIGYGLNDYNIKLILNWVKNVQEDSFIRPVFIHTDNPLSPLEMEYQKTRGLRVLQSTDFGDLTDSYSRRYANVLEAILGFEEKKNLDSFDKKMEYIAERISGISNLKYLRSEDISSIFPGDYSVEDNQVLTNISEIRALQGFSQVHKVDYFEELCAALPEHGYTCKDSIESFLKTASLIRRNQLFEKTDVTEINVYSYGTQIFAMVQYCDNEYTDDIDLFRKAYYLGILARYEESYELFTSLIRKFQEEKKWDLFYLAQINRQYLFWTIPNSSRYFKGMGGHFLFGHSVEVISGDFLKKIEMDKKAFRLEEQFMQLPVDFHSKYSFLSAFSNGNPFINQNTELLQEMNKADKDRVSGTIYIAGMPKAETIKRKMYENVKFVFENNLLISLFDEFKCYVKNSLMVWLETYAHNIKQPSKSEDDSLRCLRNNIYYSLTYMDIILMVETFTYDDVKYVSNIINLKSIPFDDEECLINHINGQIIDFVKIFPLDKELKGDKIILFTQQLKRIRLLLMISSYFVKDHDFITSVLSQMHKLWVRDFPLSEMKQIIVRWVNISGIDKQIATNIIEEWFISYVEELSPKIGVDGKLPGTENTGEFIDMLNKLCTDETKLSRISMNTMSWLKDNLAYTKLFNPLYKNLNDDVKAYIDSHVPVDSVISLSKRYGDKIPDNFDIKSVVEKTFKIISGRQKERETGVITSYQYPNKTLITQTILAMLRKGVVYEEYVGTDREYDFWFDFDNFNPNDFDVEWLSYYPDDILEMIKCDDKKKSLVIDILDRNSQNRTLDGWDLRRQYYVYRYLTK